MKNFNNPTDINTLSKSYSVIIPPTNKINNQHINNNNEISSNKLPYGYFASADPDIESRLPRKVNLGQQKPENLNNAAQLQLGITSPGTIDKATVCDGLDFINTNPNYDNIPFEYCLQKFGDHYKIPTVVFENLINNLPYVFSGLSTKEKKSYLISSVIKLPSTF
jgi:hypothetical protein